MLNTQNTPSPDTYFGCNVFNETVMRNCLPKKVFEAVMCTRKMGTPLPKDAAASSKKWKVVLLHKDVLQYRIGKRPERKEGFSKFGEAFMPLFDELEIDVVLSAHLHTYRNRGHIKAFQRDPSGPLYILTGVAGNVRYPGLWIDHALDEKIAPQPETDNYLTLEASQDALRFQCFLPDGTIIDDVTVKK